MLRWELLFPVEHELAREIGLQGARHGQRTRYLSQIRCAARLLNDLTAEVLERLWPRDLPHVPVAEVDGVSHHDVRDAGTLVVQPLGEVEHVCAGPEQDEDAG